MPGHEAKSLSAAQLTYISGNATEALNHLPLILIWRYQVSLK
ncbi:hypothetical protein DSUL_90090 [Desulfovibrionales bacterium]